MSTTALAWLLLVFTLAILSLKRPAYAFSLYMVTFFANPGVWWWGRGVLDSFPWNQTAGLILLGTLILHGARWASETTVDAGTERPGKIAILMLANATVVHLLLAPYYAISLESYSLMAKFVLLYFLMVASARTPWDFRIMIWSIILSAAYVGYEVTINDRGSFAGGRLEGAGVPGAKNANNLASLFVTILPLAGGLFYVGGRLEKVLVAITAPLILNVVLLCNSRSAFLGLGVAAGAFLVTAPKISRKYAVRGLVLAGIGLLVLLRDPDITARFMTTFVSAEERDNAANNRLVYWQAGLRMLADHPFGTGGAGFKSVYAQQYLATVGVDKDRRSVHNGIINEACEWGLQGLTFRLLFIGSAVFLMLRFGRNRMRELDSNSGVLSATMIASMVAFLVTSAFNDFLDAEWGFWVPALMVAYARLYSQQALEAGSAAVSSQGQGLWPSQGGGYLGRPAAAGSATD